MIKMQKFNFGRLELIVFISGAVVMILELIGSRILSPYLGNSIFVWASLIGIILGALALGYYLGGYFSKKNPQLSFLCAILFIAGLIILLIVTIKEPTLIYAMPLGPKIGSVMATLILFAWPSILLGMVSPYALRLKVQNVENSGGVAGNLYALSTVGSIFGTFLAGFYLIPTFGSTQILFGLSLTLIITALLGGKKMLKFWAIFTLLLIWLFGQLIPSPYIFETDSAYNHIRVIELVEPKTNLEIRGLYLTTELHSAIYKNSDNLFAGYHQLTILDNLFKPDIKTALTLGGGAYVAPQNFLKRFPDSQMTVVEIDPTVTQVARQYFGLKDNPRLSILHQDGRIFLNKNTNKYDAIYGDAFASYYSIPFQLTTKEAMKEIHDSLNDNGILVLNVISSIAGKKSMFFQAEYKTLAEIYPQIYVFPVEYYDGNNLGEVQNIVLIASKNPNRLTMTDLEKNATAEQLALLQHFWQQPITLDPKTKILTDDFAPVDYYISKLL